MGAPGLHHDNCPGVTHSDELYFFWNPFWESDYPLNMRDSEMSLKLTTMWTNFAKTGDPNKGGDTTKNGHNNKDDDDHNKDDVDLTLPEWLPQSTEQKQ